MYTWLQNSAFGDSPRRRHRSNPRLSRSARAGPAASTHIWPRGAARPSGATPPAHATRRSLSAPTMRCASLWRPSGFAKSRPHNPCHLPFAGEAAAIEELRDTAAAARFPPLHRANPPDCPHSFPARERRSPLACHRCPAPVRAPRTRESVPVVATLTPRRAARRCGSDLARPSLSLSL